jgi:hypothetical protein
MILVLAIVVVASCALDIRGAESETIAAVPQHPAPFRMVVFVDQSRSMVTARVSPVTSANLAVVYERLAASGGELALGLIRDQSDRPLVRLFVPAPPQAPPSKPAPTNIFAASAARKRELGQLVQLEASRRFWRADVAARQAAFTRAIEPLLARISDAPATDIWSACRRADIFLSEPNVFARPTLNFVVLVSDGIETASDAAPPRLNASAQLLLVNGSGETGHLGALAPIRFESVEAALRYAVDAGGSNVHR